MAQTLTVLWTPPTPDPGSYQLSYRAQGGVSYTTVNTSGSPTSIYSLVPANYEGYIQSNCLTPDPPTLSSAAPFGVNGWQPFYVNLSTSGSTWTVYGTSVYGNPYATLVSGTIYYHVGASNLTVSGSGTYPAGSTYASLLVTSVPGGAVVDKVLVTNMSPIFDNGGTLQQFDSVSTPKYFSFYNTSGCTSGNTSGCTAPAWNGSPIILPSFLLRGFNVTSVDGSGNPLSGNILVQWIQSAVYGGGLGIYSHITFNVYDPDTTLMGTVTVPYGQPGLNNATIPISKVTAPLSITSQFTMKTLWADTSVSATKLFYLPSF